MLQKVGICSTPAPAAIWTQYFLQNTGVKDEERWRYWNKKLVYSRGIFKCFKTFSDAACCGCCAKPEPSETSKASVTLSRWPMMWGGWDALNFSETVFTLLTRVHFLHKSVLQFVATWSLFCVWTQLSLNIVVAQCTVVADRGWCACLQSCIWSGYRRCGDAPAGTCDPLIHWLAASSDYSPLPPCVRECAVLRCVHLCELANCAETAVCDMW